LVTDTIWNMLIHWFLIQNDPNVTSELVRRSVCFEW